MMRKLDHSNEPAARLRPTTLDAFITGMSPVLIIGMICSLVFFLVIVVYQGQYQQRLMYILGLYTFAIVLVARIAIEQSRAVAFGYTMLLGGATLFVSLKFVAFQGGLAPFSLPIVAGFLILIGFLADRITFDCTLIDENKEESGVGLLQSLGVLANPRRDQARTETKPKKKHNPGIWVLYFAWMAVPLFGLGQLAIPGEDESSRRLASLFLFGYLFFALSLLVVTAFLSMRRYLRKRNVEMQPQLSLVWISSGIVGALALLFLTSLLPLPSGSLGMLDFPIQIESSQNLQPSQYGWGNEGVPTETEQKQKQIDEQTKNEEAVEGDGTSKNKKAAAEGKAETNGKSKENSDSSNGESKQSGDKSDRNRSRIPNPIRARKKRHKRKRNRNPKLNRNRRTRNPTQKKRARRVARRMATRVATREARREARRVVKRVAKRVARRTQRQNNPMHRSHHHLPNLLRQAGRYRYREA